MQLLQPVARPHNVHNGVKGLPMKKQKCILCIEPDGEICLLLSMMLNRNDFTVMHIGKIEDIAVHSAIGQPALIIVENSFPKNEIGAHIAAISQRSPASKILMISSVGDEAATEASSAGVDLFLTKPFSKATLLDAVLSFLD
jgi:DNA-binding NtrC family response regulator